MKRACLSKGSWCNSPHISNKYTHVKYTVFQPCITEGKLNSPFAFTITCKRRAGAQNAGVRKKSARTLRIFCVRVVQFQNIQEPEIFYMLLCE